MTDEVTGGAAAPAEAVAAPEIQAEVTPRGAIDRAFAAVEGIEPQEGAVAEKQPDNRQRNPDGTFKGKDPTETAIEVESRRTAAAKKAADGQAAETLANAVADVPARFSPDAKAAWASVPEPVKAETRRAIRELEQGIEKYRGDAAAFEPLREYDAMARQYGVTLPQALANYTALDKLLAVNPIAAFEKIAEQKGFSLREFATRYLNLPVDQQQAGSDHMVRGLQGQIVQLQRVVQQLGGGLQQMQTGSVAQVISGFRDSLSAADQELLVELDGPIGDLITKEGLSLPEAFAKARDNEKQRVTRLAASFGLSATPQTLTADPDLAAQTRKGQLSVSGAPGSGSNPASRKLPSSNREALDRAFASVGL